MDNISRLFQLQSTNKHAVVSEELNLTEVQQNLYIKTEIEEYLIESCKNAKKKNKPFLCVISGNAGDGKSMLIKQAKQELQSFLNDDEIEINYDATQVDTKVGDLTDNLFDYFSRFLEDYSNNSFKVYIIAMNIGIAIRFFNDPQYIQLLEESNLKAKHKELKEILFNELNIEHTGKKDTLKLVSNIEVINFDHRVLVTYHLDSDNGVYTDSFFQKMIDQVANIFNANECEDCSAKDKCPVYYNVQSLEQTHVRKKIENILFKIFLYKKVHFTPRNLWDFLFNLTVGGTNKFLSVKNSSHTIPCDVFRDLPEEKFVDFTFYNNLFNAGTDNVIIKYIQQNIIKFDPFYLNNVNLEVDKIFYQANPKKYIEKLKESIEVGEDYGFYGSNVNLHFELNGEGDFLEHIVRFIYFHNIREDKLGDILYSDPSQVITKDSFLSFIESLEQQHEKYINKLDTKLNKELVKNIKTALTNIFGKKMKDGTRYFQLETVSTRGKGRLYSSSQINVPLNTVVYHYMLNDNHINHIESFPSSVLVRVNDTIIEIDYQLYEVIILSSRGYNISSVDLDKFYNLKSKSKSIFTKSPDKEEIIYEFENKYFKLHYNEDEYENEFISIE